MCDGNARGKVRVDVLSQQVFEARVQFDVVFTQVAKQLVCPQDLGDSHQLENTTDHDKFCEALWNTRNSVTLWLTHLSTNPLQINRS